MMANGDREGWIFLFHPHTNNDYFLSTIKFRFFFVFKKVKRQMFLIYVEVRYTYDMVMPF